MPANFNSAAVLIVEDEPIIRMLAAEILSERGYLAYEADNADHALEELEKHPDIKLLFTDINMPGRLDGLDLAIKVINENPGIELIVTSGRHRLSDGNLPDHGSFLAKPYQPDELVMLVDKKLRPPEVCPAP